MNKLSVGNKVMLLVAPVDEGALGLYEPVIAIDGLRVLRGTITEVRVGEEQGIYEVEVVDGTNTYYSDYARKYILVPSDLKRLDDVFYVLSKEAEV